MSIPTSWLTRTTHVTAHQSSSEGKLGAADPMCALEIMLGRPCYAVVQSMPPSFQVCSPPHVSAGLGHQPACVCLPASGADGGINPQGFAWWPLRCISRRTASAPINCSCCACEEALGAAIDSVISLESQVTAPCRLEVPADANSPALLLYLLPCLGLWWPRPVRRPLSETHARVASRLAPAPATSPRLVAELSVVLGWCCPPGEGRYAG